MVKLLAWVILGHPCGARLLPLSIASPTLGSAVPTPQYQNIPLNHPLGTSPFTFITTALLTARLRLAINAIGTSWGLHPLDVSVQSLRSSGTMALLCAEVDPDIIHLIGHWWSDEMLHYLNVQAFPLLRNLAPTMLQNGNFHVIPNNRLSANQLHPTLTNQLPLSI